LVNYLEYEINSLSVNDADTFFCELEGNCPNTSQNTANNISTPNTQNSINPATPQSHIATPTNTGIPKLSISGNNTLHITGVT
jgi:hypothetical protein